MDTMKKVERKFNIGLFSSAFHYQWDENFVFSGESHLHWECIYVEKGAVVVSEDSRVYNLSAGDMIVHKSMEFHCIKSAKGSRPKVCISAFLMEGNPPKNLTEGVFTLTDEERREYLKTFKNISDFLLNEVVDDYLGQECSDSLSSFYAKLCKNHSAETPLSHSRSAMDYAKIIDAMNDRVNDNCTLEDFATTFNISVSYIKVLFKKYLGISPKTYYAQLRCAKATNLLRDGYSANDVADMMNFSSPNYFSVFFKKITGLPPATYVREKMNNE